MKTMSRWASVIAVASLGAFGCQGAVGGGSATGSTSGSTGGSTPGNGGTGVSSGAGGASTGAGGSSTATGAGGSSTGTGGSSTGTGGSSAGTGGASTGTGGATACTPLPTLTRRLWRLSAEQWGAATKDLLGLSAAPVLTSKGGESNFAFFSGVDLRVDTDMLFDMFQQSQTVLTTIDPTITTLAPCTGTTAAAQTTCATTFITALATKAYRRPLDATEVPNLLKVYAQGAMQSYKTGIELMVQSLILSTSFVYRTELGPSTLTADASGNYPNTALTPYEVASQLSFTLIGSLPDAALIAAAANGSLGTTAGVKTQIARLLGLPSVQANVTNIVLGWFNINQMFSKGHDTSFLAALATSEQDEGAIESDLLTSTQMFANSILWKGSGKIDELLTSQTVFVNQRLATLYPGVTYPGGKAPTSDTTFVAATWPASQGRSGMLTQPSYLWSASDPSLNSIVKRGKGIHDAIACQDPLGPPVDLNSPAALNVIACKSIDGTQILSACTSEIDHSNARMAFQPCKACHTQMDPYARVLQNFGPIGNYRTVDEVGAPVDPTVTFVPSSPLAGQTLTGAQAFSQALITSGVFDGCSVQQMTAYATGADINLYNTCELGPLRAATDGTVTSLFTNILLANFIQARAGGAQ
jgi:Protein of unknown function (DUF1592)/Protein of unknown function (DUF1595)/Protein of unknown function (DUF1588)